MMYCDVLWLICEPLFFGYSESGRSYTLSIALPGMILDNAQSPELKTYLVGQIARAAVIFNVDEIVVYDEACQASQYVWCINLCI